MSFDQALTGIGAIAGIDSKKDAEKQLGISNRQFQQLLDFQKSLVPRNISATTPGFSFNLTRVPGTSPRPTEAPEQTPEAQDTGFTSPNEGKGVRTGPGALTPPRAGQPGQTGGGEEEPAGSDFVIGLEPTGPFRGIVLDATGQIDAAIDQLGRVIPGFLLDRRQLNALADQTSSLQESVKPGFSQFREAGLDQIETARQATTSNLQDEFARRRISGSSFASDALSRTEAEFAQEKANFEAQSFLAELDATMKLIEQEADLTVAATNELINIANVTTTQGNLASTKGQLALGQQNTDLAALQTALGAQASTQQFLIQSAQLMQQNAQIQQQFAAQNAAGAGSFLGDLFGSVTNANRATTPSGSGVAPTVPTRTGSNPFGGTFSGGGGDFAVL